MTPSASCLAALPISGTGGIRALLRQLRKEGQITDAQIRALDWHPAHFGSWVARCTRAEAITLLTGNSEPVPPAPDRQALRVAIRIAVERAMRPHVEQMIACQIRIEQELLFTHKRIDELKAEIRTLSQNQTQLP